MFVKFNWIYPNSGALNPIKVFTSNWSNGDNICIFLNLLVDLSFIIEIKFFFLLPFVFSSFVF